ncbi:MAG TPA: C25 family cysteine peptidase [Planctomycetota bacterium]|nr:C25 family cysteine peptidase [Planctomycetota bacterium]
MGHHRFTAKNLLLSVTLILLTALVSTEAYGQAYQYYKFTPTARRGGGISIVQMSELQVSFNFTRIAAVAVTNPGGDNPGTESPPNLNDNDLTTKALDFNDLGNTSLNSFILNMGAPTQITEYRWATANDSNDRDPVSWDFLGSNDGTNYTLLDRQVNFPGIVTDPGREVYLAYIPIIRVNSISPVSGTPAGGTSVTVTGANFVSGCTVAFGGLAATGATLNSSTSVTCLAPAGSAGTTVPVTVTNPIGANDTLPNAYTYSTVTIGTITWTGTTDTKWSTPTNWDLGRAPVNGDTIVLTGAGANRPSNLDIPNLSIFGLTFDSTTTTPITITPSNGATNLTLISPLNVDTNGANHTLAADLVLNSALTATIGANRIFTITGVVSGVVANTLTLAGTGTLALTNPANTYLGATTVGSGATLSVSEVGNVGSPSGLGSSATALTLNGGTFAFAGATGSTNRAITLSANSIIDVGANSLTLTGLISGNNSLTKNGSGTLTLATANSYLNTTANAGKLVSSLPGAVGIGSLTINNNATVSLSTGTPIPSGLSGFGGSGTGWTQNGGTGLITSDVVTLTNGGLSEARSVFNNSPVANITTGFVAQFTYNSPGGADGAAFIIQNSANGATALGTTGGGLGYTGVAPSFALELNIYPNNIIGYKFGQGGSTGGYTTPSPVNIASGSDIAITLTYNGTTMTAKFVDTSNNTYTSPPFTINLSNVLASTSGYVGFSGATGGVASTQTVKNFSLTPVQPQYANSIAANNTPTLAIAATAASPAVTLGTLSLGTSASFSIVPDASTPANQGFALTMGATALNGNATIGVANNGTGLDTVTLGAVAESGQSSLTKNGTGTLSLPAANTYTGTTTVSAGTLLVDGTLNNAGGTVSVVSGAQLRGNGNTTSTGLVDRPVSLAAGSFIIPGDTLGTTAAPGIFAVNTLATPAGTVDIRLSNPATPAADFLVVTSANNLDLTAATLQIQSQSGTYAVTTLTIFQTTAGNFITGKFGTVLASATGLTVQYVNSSNTPVLLPSALTPANRVQLVLTGTAVTPATLESFAARSEGTGALLSWNCVSEYQNAGFNVYRRGQESGVRGQESGWTRVNPALIAGRITNPDSRDYRLYDWAAPGIYEYKLESVSIAGKCEAFSKLAEPIAVGALDTTMTAGALDAAIASVALEDGQKRGNSLSAEFASPEPRTSVSGQTADPTAKLAFDAQGKLLLSATSVRALHQNDAFSAVAQSAIDAIRSEPRAQGSGTIASSSPAGAAAGARWFTATTTAKGSFTAAKVVYNAPGVMLIPQSMLPAGFNVNRLSITREGRALTALALTSNGLLVFAPGYQDDYTDKDALFLRATNGATPAGQVLHASGLFGGLQAANTTAPASATTSYHDVYFDFNYRPFTFAPWFSSQYLTDGTTQSFTINTPNASSGASALTVNLWSLTDTDHALQVLVNGQPAGQATWTGGNTMMQLSFQMPPGGLIDGSNQIDLVTPALNSGTDTGSGTGVQISFLHSMTMSYTRTLDGSQALTVNNPSAQSKLFEIAHLPSSGDAGSEIAWVVDARYPDRATLIPYEAQAQADGTYTLRFTAPAGGTGQYLVVPAGQENLPISISKRQVKPVTAMAYMPVGPAQFSAAVQPLLMQRAKEGLRGSFVDQEQIFDYYNYGRYGPTGIQNAVRSIRPRYVLLLGRTTYDYRNYSGLGVDPLCPTFLVSTSFWAQATSDSMFGDLGRGYPEVAVGRLPVNNASELSNAVQHVLNNTGLSTGYRVHAAADRADPDAGDFAAEAGAIAQAHPDLAWQPNYLGVTYQTSPEVTAALTQAANGGADLLIYIGHGNAVRLGNEVPRILDNDSVSQWTGSAVFLQSTCTANWMAKDEAGYQSIAIQALTQPQGGISASIASSTYMNSQNATEFMSQLLTNAGTTQRWGNALLKTQQWAYAKGSGFYTDLTLTEQIFGDPAMPVMSKAAAATAAGGTTTTGTKTAPTGTMTTTGTMGATSGSTGSVPSTTTGPSVVPGQF